MYVCMTKKISLRYNNIHIILQICFVIILRQRPESSDGGLKSPQRDIVYMTKRIQVIQPNLFRIWL